MDEAIKGLAAVTEKGEVIESHGHLFVVLIWLQIKETSRVSQENGYVKAGVLGSWPQTVPLM